MSKFCQRELLEKLLTARREAQSNSATVRKAHSQELMFASHAMLQAHARQPTFVFAEDALKLAHLDSLFDVCNRNTSPTFHFAVLAANAQGIAEYIAWKHGEHAKGKIVDEPSFNGSAAAAEIETISPPVSIANSHYVSGGLPEMLEALCAEPWAPQSLSFVFCDVPATTFESLCADSSLSSELGREGSPDAKLAAACQIDAALRLMRPGANMVFRLGDCFSRWTCGLMYMLHRSFKCLRIVKPFSSSPLDPERFVVCSEFVGMLDGVPALLESVKQECRRGVDVLSIVPMDQLMQKDFNAFVTRANDRFVRRELDAWQFLRAGSTHIDHDDFKRLGSDCLALSLLNTNASDSDPQSTIGGSFVQGESAAPA
jgi:hypothetical protein